jgi:hypothetical protein
VRSDDDDVVALVREKIKTIRDRLTKAGFTTRKSGKGITTKVLVKELVRLEREAAHGQMGVDGNGVDAEEPAATTPMSPAAVSKGTKQGRKKATGMGRKKGARKAKANTAAADDADDALASAGTEARKRAGVKKARDRGRDWEEDSEL